MPGFSFAHPVGQELLLAAIRPCVTQGLRYQEEDQLLQPQNHVSDSKKSKSNKLWNYINLWALIITPWPYFRYKSYRTTLSNSMDYSQKFQQCTIYVLFISESACTLAYSKGMLLICIIKKTVFYLIQKNLYLKNYIL